MKSKPIFVHLKSVVDKQLQISPKSNDSVLPKIGWVVIVYLHVKSAKLFYKLKCIYFFSYKC